MNKHNKKRNSAFIYEVLIREIVKQSLGKNTIKRNLAISILKEHFNKFTALYSDLVLYKTILETKNVSEKFATKLLNEVKIKRSRLNKKMLFEEQSTVIAKINKEFPNSVFTNYVPTYKYLASIGQFFNNRNLKPKVKIILEEKIIEYMIQESMIGVIPKQELKLDDMIIKTFTKKFNKFYKNKLLEEQRQLLNKFITSISDNGIEFKMHVDREISRLKEALEEGIKHEEVLRDNSMKVKFNKILSFLNETHKRPLDEKLLLCIVQIQQLVDEIQIND